MHHFQDLGFKFEVLNGLRSKFNFLYVCRYNIPCLEYNFLME